MLELLKIADEFVLKCNNFDIKATCVIDKKKKKITSFKVLKTFPFMTWKHMCNLKVNSAGKLATSFLRRLGVVRSEEQIEGNLLFDTWAENVGERGRLLKP